jgi:hypothetical protein
MAMLQQMMNLQNASRPMPDEYAIASPMQQELAAWSFENKITAAIEDDDHAAQTIDLGAWQAIVSFGSNRRANTTNTNEAPTGKVLFIKLDENKFLVTGTNAHITFRPAGNNANKAWQYLKVEEGYFEKGAFKALRILNGDETDWGGPGFTAASKLLQVSLVVR